MSRSTLVTRLIVATAIFGAILFGLAGRLDWTMGWVTLLAYGITYIGVLLVTPVEAGLIKERGIAPQRDTPWWDRLITSLGSLVFPLGFLVIGGLDQRNGWTATKQSCRGWTRSSRRGTRRDTWRC